MVNMTMTHENPSNEIAQQYFVLPKNDYENKWSTISSLQERVWNHAMQQGIHLLKEKKKKEFNFENQLKFHHSKQSTSQTQNQINKTLINEEMDDIEASMLKNLNWNSNINTNNNTNTQLKTHLSLNYDLISNKQENYLNYYENSLSFDKETYISVNNANNSVNSWKEFFKVKNVILEHVLKQKYDSKNDAVNDTIAISLQLTDDDIFKDLYLMQSGLEYILPFKIYQTDENEEGITFVNYETEVMSMNLNDIYNLNLSWREIVKFMSQVLIGLYHAGIVHGTISPENIKINRNHVSGILQPYITNWGQFDKDYKIIPGDSFYLEEYSIITNVHDYSSIDIDKFQNNDLNYSDQSSDLESQYIYKYNKSSRNIDMFRIGIIFYSLLTGDNTCIFKELKNNRELTISNMKAKLDAKGVDFGIQSLIFVLIHPNNDFHYDAFITYLQYRSVIDLIKIIRKLLNNNPEEINLIKSFKKFEETHAEISKRDIIMDEFFILQHADVLVEYSNQEILEFISKESFKKFIIKLLKTQYSKELAIDFSIILRHINNRSSWINELEEHVSNHVLINNELDDIKYLCQAIEFELNKKSETHDLRRMLMDIEMSDLFRNRYINNLKNGNAIHLSIISESWLKYKQYNILSTIPSNLKKFSDIKQIFQQYYPGRSIILTTNGSIILSYDSSFNQQKKKKLEVTFPAGLILLEFNKKSSFTTNHLQSLTNLSTGILEKTLKKLIEKNILKKFEETYQLNEAFFQ